MDQASSEFEFYCFMELPENVHETILSFCDFQTKLSISESCTHLNRLLFSSPKLINRMQLSLDLRQSNLISILSTILANKRKYQKLELIIDSTVFDSIAEPLIQCLTKMSSQLKEVSLAAKSLTSDQFAYIFGILNKTENLTLRVRYSKERLPNSNNDADQILKNSNFLPKLKELYLKAHDSNQFLKYFENVKTLTRLQIFVTDSIPDITEDVERFITQQSGLKHLSIEETSSQSLPWSALSRAEFHLESLEICFYSLDRASVEFFKKQKYLKTITIKEYVENLDSESIKAILTLPKLQSLDINDCISIDSLVGLSNVTNPSVLKLNYFGHDSMVLEALISYFPNVTEVMFNLFPLLLTNTSCEKLALLQFHPRRFSINSLHCLSYQPSSSINTNQETFENNFIIFLSRHRYITFLRIGHSDWIENNFMLSRSFWLKLFELLKLEGLILYNPMEIANLVRLLTNMRTKIKTTIYTSAEGIAAVAVDGPRKCRLGSWLNIIEV